MTFIEYGMARIEYGMARIEYGMTYIVDVLKSFYISTIIIRL